MRVVIVGKDNKARFNKILESILYIIGYTISFFLVSNMFDSFKLSSSNTVLYSLLAVVVIFLLNKTVKPILVFFTMPITGITLGLFYFVLNSVILKLADLIMGSKLDFTNIWVLFFISVVISLINLLIELMIIKPIIKKVKING